eukprot:TRINITY_DN40822_c0_g1_i1.p1 TRINITY_DN40822_c0_g1~~TRINITY_DN40822_c0_g1_i1.p1  ORF type:complete len:772 (+),score=158.40 TRINITY_DN40822_c0_g1_i1:276-2591(+)
MKEPGTISCQRREVLSPRGASTPSSLPLQFLCVCGLCGAVAIPNLFGSNLRFQQRQACSGGCCVTLAPVRSLPRFFLMAAIVASAASTAMGFRTEDHAFGTVSNFDVSSASASVDQARHKYKGYHLRGDRERQPGAAIASTQLSISNVAAEDDLSESEDVDDDLEDSDEFEGNEGGNGEETGYSALDATNNPCDEQAKTRPGRFIQPSAKLIASLEPVWREQEARRQRLEKTLSQSPQATQPPPDILRNVNSLLDSFNVNIDGKVRNPGANGLVQSKGSLISRMNASLHRKTEPEDIAENAPIEADPNLLATQDLQGSSVTAKDMADATQKVEEFTAQAEKAKKQVDDAMKLAQETADAAEMSAMVGAAETQTLSPMTNMPTKPEEVKARREQAMRDIETAVNVANSPLPKLASSSGAGLVATPLPHPAASPSAGSALFAARAAAVTTNSAADQEAKPQTEAEDEIAKAAEQISKGLASISPTPAIPTPPTGEESGLQEVGSRVNAWPSHKKTSTALAESSALREAALRQEIQDKAAELAALQAALSQEVEGSAARAKQAAVDADVAAGQVEMAAERARRAAHAAGAAAEEAAKKAIHAEQVAAAAAKQGVEGHQRDPDKKPALDSEDGIETKAASEENTAQSWPEAGDDHQGEDESSSDKDRHRDARSPSSLQRDAQNKFGAGKESSPFEDKANKKIPQWEDRASNAISRREDTAAQEVSHQEVKVKKDRASPRRRKGREPASPPSSRRRPVDGKASHSSTVSRRRREKD